MTERHSEAEYRAVLMRLYAEFTEEANRRNREAEICACRGRSDYVPMKREKAAAASASAAKVRYLCRQLGFDPADGIGEEAEGA